MPVVRASLSRLLHLLLLLLLILLFIVLLLCWNVRDEEGE